jgi:hypothetical protein
MPISRFGSGKPAADTNLLLYTVARSSLISVVAVNLSGATKITAWIIPNTQEESPDNWIYFGNQIPLTSRNTFETFKTSVNVGDKVYVKSESGNVSFFVNGIYDTTGTTDVSVGTEPTNPQVGTLWINTSFDPARVFYWDGEDWVDVGTSGPENVLSIGTVETADFGDPAAATITGDSPEQVLNLVLPVGAQGPANTLTVGTVTSVDFGDDPEVTITGDAPDQTINFVLPVGDAGPSNTLTLGTVTTGEPGSDAIVEITGTSPEQTINFTIPEGPVGVSNTLTVGTVTSVSPIDDPSVTITGDSPNQVINFALKQGIQGPPGDLGTATLGDLQDVEITGTPTEGSLLVYNETSEQWENRESSGNIPDLNMVIMGAY